MTVEGRSLRPGALFPLRIAGRQLFFLSLYRVFLSAKCWQVPRTHQSRLFLSPFHSLYLTRYFGKGHLVASGKSLLPEWFYFLGPHVSCARVLLLGGTLSPVLPLLVRTCVGQIKLQLTATPSLLKDLVFEYRHKLTCILGLEI